VLKTTRSSQVNDREISSLDAGGGLAFKPAGR
jgi:hypothetical protein